MTTEIAEVESPDEAEYRRLSTRLTMLDLAIEQTQQEFDKASWAKPKISFPSPGGMVFGADAERDALEHKLQELFMARQAILPRWSQLKFDLHLSR